MKKRLFAAFLTLVLALGMLPSAALAEDGNAPTGTAPGEPAAVTTEGELRAALESGAETIRLGANITLEQAPLRLNRSVALDLSGKSIESAQWAIAVEGDVSVTIRNGAINTAIVISAGAVSLENLTVAAQESCVFVTPEAKVSINSCAIKSAGEGDALYYLDRPDSCIAEIAASDAVIIDKGAATYTVTTEDELRSALESGADTIRLGGNIALTTPLFLNKSVAVDLNGKSIKPQEGFAEEVFIAIGFDENVNAGSLFTIYGGTINAPIMIAAGTVALEHLTVTTAADNCVMVVYDSSMPVVTVKECSIKSDFADGWAILAATDDNPDNWYRKDIVSEKDVIHIEYPNKKEEAETYYISVPRSDGGEVIPNARYAAAGERVTVTARPEDRHETAEISVTDIRGRAVTLRDMGKNQWSFVMPASKVEVTAVFAEIGGEQSPAESNANPNDEAFTGLGAPGISGIALRPGAMPFTDVRANDWFYTSVEYMWKHYLMSGVSDTRFDPNAPTTRAMIWTILARMNNVRTDINPGSTWYERGMLWSMEQGLTDGSEPMANITREQLATMLWRSAGSPGGTADLSRFSDSAKISGYAESAVRWAVGIGVLNGSGGTLNPQGTAARAEVAAMVARYGEKAA